MTEEDAEEDAFLVMTGWSFPCRHFPRPRLPGNARRAMAEPLRFDQHAVVRSRMLQ